MNDGHFFEIKPSDTSLVWEYINPVTRDGVKKIKVDNYPTYNGVFRAYRYAATHPALAGHDLTPGNTITASVPNYYIPSDLTFIKENEPEPLPQSILNQNYPNPFSGSTQIQFEISESKLIIIEICDFSGNKVKTLMSKTYPKGKYSLTWDGTNDSGTKVATGVYFYILTADNQRIAKKMIHFR